MLWVVGELLIGYTMGSRGLLICCAMGSRGALNLLCYG